MTAPRSTAARQLSRLRRARLPLVSPIRRLRALLIAIAVVFSLCAGRALQVQAFDAKTYADDILADLERFLDEYKNLVSIPNIMNSSTAWLMIQAIISQYGEAEGKAVLSKLIQNCGPHIEKSGSGPIKKVRAGEVAVGFGLRHQAVADKASGKPIDFVDPIEGNYSLTEGVSVVKKADAATTQLAMDMAKVIIGKARATHT